MSLPILNHLFIFEPDQGLTLPYQHFTAKHCTRLDSITPPPTTLNLHKADLILLSASFEPAETVTFLEKCKDSSSTHLIPLIIVINLSNKVSTVLGTTWGGQLGLATNLSSHYELKAMLNRILHPPT